MDEVATLKPAPKDGQDSIARLDHLDPETVSKEFVRQVPISFARRFGLLGLESKNGAMPVAMSSLASISAMDKVSVLLGWPTHPVLIEAQALTLAINQAYGLQESGVENVIASLNGEDIDSALNALTQNDLLDTDSASPVTRLVNLILLDAVKRRASDVHVNPMDGRLVVRLRIDGVLYDYVEPPTRLLDEIVSRIKVMGRMNIAEKRLAQDGRTTVTVGDKPIDLRISTLPTRHGERVVLRLLDKSARLYTLPQLGMSDAYLGAFRQLIRQSHGIILVTGPTGSGKTTTLYAALQELNRTELNVLTLEDPIEYELPGISQTQVSDKKGMTFATGLRTVLRQDPDVIMVGEIRDQETARMAIQSSLTGHLVFSTLHTNDAAGAVARLLDLGVEPYLVADSLRGVLAQRLVRRVCGHCRVEQTLAKRDAVSLQIQGEHHEAIVYTACGCPRCHQTGYHDRVGIFELLPISEAVHDLITAGAKSREIKQAAMRNGMTTLRQDAVRKLVSGTTTIEEVRRVTSPDTNPGG